METDRQELEGLDDGPGETLLERVIILALVAVIVVLLVLVYGALR